MNFNIRKYLPFFILTFAMLGGCSDIGKGNLVMAKDISLVISVDSKEFKIGDSIKITYSFINNSAKSVAILPWCGGYTTKCLLLYDSAGKLLKSVKIKMIELKVKPGKEDFKFLDPGEKIRYSFIGKVKKNNLTYLGSKQDYKGLFIDFGDSAYLLDSPGEYRCKIIYKVRDEWINTAQQLSIDNIWMSNLESNEITISIDTAQD